MDVKLLEMRLKQKEEAGVFRKDEYAKNLASQYLEKARHNLVCMRTSYDISTNPGLKSAASLPKDFNEFDWAVIKAYYAMYHSGLACLAKIGYKSDDHNASIMALELFFVHNGLLERRYLQLMEKVRFWRMPLSRRYCSQRKQEGSHNTVSGNKQRGLRQKKR